MKLKNIITKQRGVIVFIAKQKIHLLLIVLLGEILLFFILGKLYYEDRKEAFSQRAESVFKEVLLQQLQEDSFEGYIYSSEKKQQMVEYPDTVYITDENGKHGYRLDKEKSRKNITSDIRLRFLHSTYLYEHPLSLDSLYEKYQQHLKQQNLSATFALQLWVSDKNENITSCIYPDTFSLKDCMPEFDITAGYRCELEIKGFFNLSFFNVIGNSLMYGLFYWLIVIIVDIALFFRKKEYKDIIAQTTVHTYQLDQDIIFDADQRMLVVYKNKISMLPQTTILLRYFLNAPDYILKDEEIKKIFWSDKSNNEPRLHNAISRLRRVFKTVSSIEVLRLENNGYQLQIRRNEL